MVGLGARQANQPGQEPNKATHECVRCRCVLGAEAGRYIHRGRERNAATTTTFRPSACRMGAPALLFSHVFKAPGMFSIFLSGGKKENGMPAFCR